MPRVVRCGLIQAKNVKGPEAGLPAIKKAMIDKHLKLIEQAGRGKVQILCLQEIFYGPYFCAEQETRWYHLTERVPDGPTVRLMQKLARKHKMVMVVPIYEEEQAGRLLQHRRPSSTPTASTWASTARPTSPTASRASGRSSTSGPATSAIRSSRPPTRRSASTSATTATFPGGARALGLNGAEIVFNPSATVAGLSEYLWKLEQPAHAVANGYFVGAINRVGIEAPWKIGEFYGQSYFCDPRGKIVAQGPRDKDAVVVADLNLDLIEEVRSVWQFYRDRLAPPWGPSGDARPGRHARPHQRAGPHRVGGLRDRHPRGGRRRRHHARRHAAQQHPRHDQRRRARGQARGGPRSARRRLSPSGAASCRATPASSRAAGGGRRARLQVLPGALRRRRVPARRRGGPAGGHADPGAPRSAAARARRAPGPRGHRGDRRHRRRSRRSLPIRELPGLAASVVGDRGDRGHARRLRETGCRVHIVHLSSAEALPILAEARSAGLPITVETCPHYLSFAAEEIPDGATDFKCAPPIRERANRERALGRRSPTA